MSTVTAEELNSTDQELITYAEIAWKTFVQEIVYSFWSSTNDVIDKHKDLNLFKITKIIAIAEQSKASALPSSYRPAALLFAVLVRSLKELWTSDFSH